jgi:hypothetical protein
VDPPKKESPRLLGGFAELVAPALGGLVILVSNWLGVADVAYRAIFAVAAVSLVCGILVVRRIRLPA